MILRELACAVCADTEITIAALRGPEMRHAVAHPRQRFMAEAYATGLFSLGQIGLWLARDHTTVLHGIAAHHARLAGATPVRRRGERRRGLSRHDQHVRAWRSAMGAGA